LTDGSGDDVLDVCQIKQPVTERPLSIAQSVTAKGEENHA